MLLTDAFKTPEVGHTDFAFGFFPVTGRRGQAYCPRGNKILSGMTAVANINTVTEASTPHEYNIFL